MSLPDPKAFVTEERLNEYHNFILPFLGGNSMVACGGGYAPIGTIIAFMGNTAPSDFLACDGSILNIADYTELADFFELQFGSANYFGGDGNTTFAVPDLRGEFLRGSGTNSHTNQGNGANVGVHQDGTLHPMCWADQNAIANTYAVNISDTFDNRITNISSKFTTNIAASDSYGSHFTSRPTNTSVLYCIKAKSQGNGYSTDEQIISTWIDGKPLYQKAIEISNVHINNNSVTIADASGLNIIDAKGFVIEGAATIFLNDILLRIMVTNNNLALYSTSEWNISNGTIIIQYTKTTD